ncbi:MAG TPA: AMIN domain-containing protein, partial [Sneathiellales bacterium]|nr:AMIN domain-containing protein [Sneathiellales bacterium]
MSMYRLQRLRRILGLALPFAGMLMAALSVTPVQAQSVATTFRTGEHPGKTRFVLELSEKPEYTIFTLDEPYRIVIDFKGVDWQVAPSLHKRGQGVIKGIRNGSSGAGNHRVVLDLAGPALVLNDFMLDPDDGYPWLFVLDLSRTSRAAFQTARNGIVAAPASQMARAPAVAPLFPPLQPGPRTIIAEDTSGAVFLPEQPMGELVIEPAQADGLSDFSFGSLQRKIAVFDPAGRHLIRPLVRRVPGLTAKGSYYFSSGVLLQKNDGAGVREKDFRLLQAQNVFEAEFSYRISQGLSLTSVNHFLYDAVYHI